MHTISTEARPVQARDSRKGAQPAYTAQGDRIVKRHSGPTALPLGTTVIEQLGGRLRRTSLAGWQVLHLVDGEPIGEVIPTDELAYPIVEIKPKQRGHHLPREERRRDERVARKAEAKFKRFKRRRVDEYLAATAAAGIDEQRARAVAGVTR